MSASMPSPGITGQYILYENKIRVYGEWGGGDCASVVLVQDNAKTESPLSRSKQARCPHKVRNNAERVFLQFRLLQTLQHCVNAIPTHVFFQDILAKLQKHAKLFKFQKSTSQVEQISSLLNFLENILSLGEFQNQHQHFGFLYLLCLI